MVEGIRVGRKLLGGRKRPQQCTARERDRREHSSLHKTDVFCADKPHRTHIFCQYTCKCVHVAHVQGYTETRVFDLCAKYSSSFVVAMSLLNIDEHTLTTFLSTPSAPSLRSPSPLTGIRTSTTASSLTESLAEWLTEPQTRVMSPTSASASAQSSHRSSIRRTTSKRFSEELALGRSQSVCHKSEASTVPTVFGSSAGQSFGKPERDCVSETSLFPQLTRPRKLESSSVVHNRGVDAER